MSPYLYYVTLLLAVRWHIVAWYCDIKVTHFTVPAPDDGQLDCVGNVMAQAQKTDFVFRRNGRVHLNRRGLQFIQLLAGDLCASRVVMLDTPCSEVVWRVLATHSIRQFPLRSPSRGSRCAITFQLDSTVVAQSGIATRLRAGQRKDPDSISGSLLVSKLSKTTPGHIQHPIKRITRAVGGKAGRWNLISPVHLIPKLWMSGVIPPLPHKSFWSVQRQYI